MAILTVFLHICEPLHSMAPAAAPAVPVSLDSPKVSNPSALATERPLLHLVPRDEIAAMVNALDAAIDDEPPPRPVGVLRGTVDEFDDWAAPGSTLIRHVTPGGVPILRNIPTHLITYPVRAAFYDLSVAIEQAEAMQSGGPARA